MSQTFMEKFRELNERVTRSAPKDPRPWTERALPHQTLPEGSWRVFALCAGRGVGKQLDVATPIPTPYGWTRMGDLTVGSEVFDESGNPCRVTFVSAPKIPPIAYRVTFADGHYIDACGDHLWVTWTHRERKQTYRSAGNFLTFDKRPITTEELRGTLRFGKRGDLNHCVPVCDGLQLPESDLAIEPYQLGLWLGDGTSSCAAITVSKDDAGEILSAFGDYLVGAARNPGPNGSATYRINSLTLSDRRDRITGRFAPDPDSLESKLSALGVLNNKHVPDAYLRASYDQRLALLQGLMDSDGYADSRGNIVEFCSTEKKLADAVFELAVSLGQKPRMSESDAKLYGRVTSKRWRIGWTPTVPVFRLKRKLERIVAGRSQAARHRHRMVVSVEPLPSAPVMRCIAVDSPNRLYLAGRGMIPTHNTFAGAETVNMWARSLPGSRGILVGRTASDVRGTMLEGPAGLCTLYPDIEYEPSKQRITWPNGTVAQLLYAESPHMLRGPQCHWFWADEISSWSDVALGDREDTAWNNLMMGCRLGTEDGWKAKGIATFTPKPNPLVLAVLNHPRTVVKTASTYDNPHLDEDSQDFFRETYEGSRIARQEIHGELLLEAANALWSTDDLDANRVKELPSLVKIAVAWDPATTSGEYSDEHGIIVAGVDDKSHGYVLEDASGRMTPDRAASKVIELYQKWKANMVVYEQNQGGDFVPTVLRSVATGIPCIGVHAKNGKRLRAEPVQARYQQGRVHHVGVFHKLETQMTTWDPDDVKMKSPDRVDATVYALTWAFEGEGGLARQSFRIGFRRR